MSQSVNEQKAKISRQDLDIEWVKLILIAKEAGLTVNDLRTFFKENRQSE